MGLTKAQPTSITEERYHSNTAGQYTSTGKVRCQGIAHQQLARLRLEIGQNIGPDEAWAHYRERVQCDLAALPGTFACNFHGGKRQLARKEKVSPANYLPEHLQERYEEMIGVGDAEILNSTDEIAQLKTRLTELYSGIDNLVIGPEGWALVAQAKFAVERGDIVFGVKMLEQALKDEGAARQTWMEVRSIIELMDRLRKTQFSMMKDMQTMATDDQIRGIVETYHRATKAALEEVIPDPVQVQVVMSAIARKLKEAKT